MNFDKFDKLAQSIGVSFTNSSNKPSNKTLNESHNSQSNTINISHELNSLNSNKKRRIPVEFEHLNQICGKASRPSTKSMPNDFLKMSKSKINTYQNSAAKSINSSINIKKMRVESSNSLNFDQQNSVKMLEPNVRKFIGASGRITSQMRQSFITKITPFFINYFKNTLKNEKTTQHLILNVIYDLESKLCTRFPHPSIYRGSCVDILLQLRQSTDSSYIKQLLKTYDLNLDDKPFKLDNKKFENGLLNSENLDSNTVNKSKKVVDQNSLCLTKEQMITHRYASDLVLRDIRNYSDQVSTSSSTSNSSVHKVLAMDCEMCKTIKGMELTRVSIVDVDQNLVYDRYVKPENQILDYFTQFSGISMSVLDGVETRLKDVQKDLLNLISSETILIGHSLENDLKALHMVHRRVIDTAVLYMVYPISKLRKPYKISLKKLSLNYLDTKIQGAALSDDEALRSHSGHDSIEDAISSLRLARRKLGLSYELVENNKSPNLSNFKAVNTTEESSSSSSDTEIDEECRLIKIQKMIEQQQVQSDGKENLTESQSNKGSPNIDMASNSNDDLISTLKSIDKDENIDEENMCDKENSSTSENFYLSLPNISQTKILQLSRNIAFLQLRILILEERVVLEKDFDQQLSIINEFLHSETYKTKFENYFIDESFGSKYFDNLIEFSSQFENNKLNNNSVFELKRLFREWYKGRDQ